MSKFQKGDILEFDGMGFYNAKPGATAVCKGYLTTDGIEYVIVEWIKNELSEDQNDGGYFEQNFIKIED